MHVRKSLLYLLFFYAGNLFSQSIETSISGKVIDNNGEAIPYAIVKLDSLSKGTMADEEGRYILQNVPTGHHRVSTSAIGYEPQSRTVSTKVGKDVKGLDFTLVENAKQLGEVVVEHKTEEQKIKETGFQVDAIDARKLANYSSDLNKALSTVSGVRIREEGGLGSRFDFSLNGFSGNQVKFFLDGIPMENFGSSLTLNNIPINLAERIEMYKGVVPAHLGADALGGAVNIVTNRSLRNYVDASYTYGSFNTHRSSVNFGIADSATGLTLRANLFQNYSDNSYRVEVDKQIGSKIYNEKMWARRFHDAYDSKTAIVDMGLVGKRYADQLLLGIVVSGSDKEIQTASTMEKVYGERRQLSTTLMPTFKYRVHNLFAKGLDMSTYASYNFGSTQNIDTARFRTYYWDGSYGSAPNVGERSYTLYKFSDNLILGNANLSYAISKQHSFVLNAIYNSFDRKGSDEKQPSNRAYKDPQKVSKTILALGYRFDWKDKVIANLFVKHFLLNGATYYTANVYQTRDWVKRNLVQQNTGLGIALSYRLVRGLRLKASYENTYRLPEGPELFGDGVNLLGNPNLEPEQSQNLNLGLSYQGHLHKNHKLLLETSYLLRKVNKLIRTEVMDPNSEVVNLPGMEGYCIEGNLQYDYRNLVRFTANGTYQILQSTQKYDEKGDILDTYLKQIPNIPYLFANTEISLNLDNVVMKKDRFSVGYGLYFVEEYFLKWDVYGSRDEKLTIPRQFSHMARASYSIKNGRYNISFECSNFLDAMLYDNYKLQKPGRAFYLKLRYFLSKQ